MKQLKDSDVSGLSPKQKKIYKKILSLPPIGVVRDVLSFYKCPDSCGAKCCKTPNIPLIMDDKARISRRGIGYRKVIKEQTKSIEYEFEGENIKEDVFSAVPCPFLKHDRCSIHRFNPIICSVYPFKVTQRLKSNLELIACPLGADIAVDFAAFELAMAALHKAKPELVSNKLDEVKKVINTIDTRGFAGPESYAIFGVTDFESLKYFLLYLHSEVEGSIPERRESLKDIVRSGSLGIE